MATRHRRAILDLVEAGVHGLVRHWLALVNIGFTLFVGLAFLAPLLMALGLTAPALWLYRAYEATCHQWAFRSFFLFGEQAAYSQETLRPLVGDGNIFTFIGNPQLGYKIAFCQRDVAIFGAMLLFGIAFSWIRPRLRPPPLWLFALLLVPIAADGFTQLFALRESTWELRVLTGVLFGAASVWLIYPQLDRSARRAQRSFGLL